VLAIVLLIRGVTFSAGTPAGRTYTNGIGMEFVRVEPGSFVMGDAEGGGFWDESPAHKVTITRPFYISTTEVTVEQFRRFRRRFEGNRLFRPYAAGVSWHEAVEFCRWLSRKEKKTCRLPTEIEWEWSWPRQEKTLVPARALSHTAGHEEITEEESQYCQPFGYHTIGFRVVQADMPGTEPYVLAQPTARSFVKPAGPQVAIGPDPDRPGSSCTEPNGGIALTAGNTWRLITSWAKRPATRRSCGPAATPCGRPSTPTTAQQPSGITGRKAG
jgi:hypothetical protein